jgi:hypothetical protein
MQNDFNDILILINVGQKLKKNTQYILYLHIFHQRLPNMVKRLFADVVHDAIVVLFGIAMGTFQLFNNTDVFYYGPCWEVLVTWITEPSDTFFEVWLKKWFSKMKQMHQQTCNNSMI